MPFSAPRLVATQCSPAKRAFGSARGRITLGFVLLLVTLALILGVAVTLIGRHRSELVQLNRDSAQASALQSLNSNFLTAHLLEERYIDNGQDWVLPIIDISLSAAAANAVQARQQSEPAERPAMDEIVQGVAADTVALGRVLALRTNGDAAGARALGESFVDANTAFGTQLAALVDDERAQAAADTRNVDRAANQVFWTLIATGIVGAAFSLFALVVIARSIFRPLAALERVAQAISGGDLSARASTKGPAELVALGSAFNSMTDSLVDHEQVQALNTTLAATVAELEREVNQRRKTEEAIKHQAYHDPLTDLPNRTLFKERLDTAIGRARRDRSTIAVLFVDLDRFKVVNDTAGHDAGDLLLQGMAADLSELVREGDTVARVGGDEFMVLLDGLTSPDEAEEIAQRIVLRLRHPNMLLGHEFNITASIGISLFPLDDADSESLITHADIAMYRAKETGRNMFRRYTADMNETIIQRRHLENDLRHALERGEMKVYYQPLVNTASGVMTSVEALARWDHPTRGLVMPDEFIPLAEETGLIVELGGWVLRTACAQVKAWQDDGYPDLKVGVNLSARQFQQLDIVHEVEEALRATGLAPTALQIEVTEATAIRNVDYTIAVLDQLRALGVRVAIDDFGTGYSGLSYLNRFPVDVLKVDQSFVRDVLSNPREARITTSVIALAHQLGLQVVAEGVETEGQLAFLLQRNCDEVQGFLFSEGVPASGFKAALAMVGRRREPSAA